MLQIDIVGSAGDNLTLEVNGHANNGRSDAKAGWAVQWKVKRCSGVDHIKEIRLKQIVGNTDIFSDDPPAPQGGSQMKRWNASVNADAVDYSECAYDIVWVKEGETNTRTYDPIIAIKPSLAPSLKHILTATVAISAAVAVFFFLYGRGKKWNKNKLW